MFADPEHMRYYPAPFTREQTVAWIERRLTSTYRDQGFGLLIAEDDQTAQLLGTVGPTVQIVEDLREIELGWHIRPGHKGKGYAPEAAAAARDWAFANLEVGMLHLVYRVDRPG